MLGKQSEDCLTATRMFGLYVLLSVGLLVDAQYPEGRSEIRVL